MKKEEVWFADAHAANWVESLVPKAKDLSTKPSSMNALKKVTALP